MRREKTKKWKLAALCDILYYFLKYTSKVIIPVIFAKISLLSKLCFTQGRRLPIRDIQNDLCYNKVETNRVVCSEESVFIFC